MFFQDEEDLVKFREQQKSLIEKHPDFIDDVMIKQGALRKNCGAICSQVSIKVNGDVKLCNMDNGRYFNLRIGNVITNPIKELFDNNKNFLENFGETKPPMMEDEECKNCEKKTFCSNCFLRGILGAKELSKMDRKCGWYQKIHPVVKERFPLNWEDCYAQDCF